MRRIGLSLLSFISLLCFTASAFALPFNITATSPLPKFILPGEQVLASYTVANNTISQRNNNYVKYLPPNVSVITGSGCSNQFNLAPRGQPGSSCTLFLSVTGPVNARDPNPHHHLFVCFPKGITCAGTRDSLNVKSSNNLNRFAYVANHINDRTVSICPVFQNGNLAPCTLHFDPTFGAPIDVILNSQATFAYVANSNFASIVNTISVCPVNPNGTLNPCQSASAPFTDFTGLAFNPSETLIYYTDFLNDRVRICPVNPNGSLGTCSISPVIFSGPNGKVSFNNNGTIIYVGNFNTETVSFCQVSSSGAISHCQNFADPAFTGILGTAINVANTFLYVPNFDGVTSTIAICPINPNGSLTLPCTSVTGNGTFNFSDFFAINIHINSLIRAYIPNGGTAFPGSISICPFIGNGLFGTCTNFTDPLIQNPDGIYVATFGQFG